MLETNTKTIATAPLVRGIRRWDLVALMINAIVGAGIFGLPSTVFALTNTYSLFAYLLCAVLVAALGLCAWLLTSTTWNEVRTAGIAALVGLIFWRGARRDS